MFISQMMPQTKEFMEWYINADMPTFREGVWVEYIRAEKLSRMYDDGHRNN